MIRTMSLTIPSLIPKSQTRARSLLPGTSDSEPDDDEFPDENVIDPDEELWARLYKLGESWPGAGAHGPTSLGDPADASNWDWFKHFFPTDLLPEMADLMTERGLARGYKDWKVTVGLLWAYIAQCAA
eukprot:jgi/Mesvir1/8638/Mv02585-RA.1